MKDLFDRLVAEKEAGILRLIEIQTQEGLEIDFKQKEDASNGNFSRGDSKTFAQALSAFANSAGGLLIFGVDARKNADGLDCAQAVAPISQIATMLGEANTLLGQYIQPRLDGVQTAAINSDQNPGSGYLLVYVPRSERRPHRSEVKGQKSYFKRIGDSFFEMEHYDIEDAFSRRSLAVLEGFTEKNSSFPSPQGLGREFLFAIGLKNISEVTARLPFIAIRKLINCRHSAYGTDYNGVIARGHGDENLYHGNQDFIIFPGQSCAMLRLAILGQQTGTDWMVEVRPDFLADVSFEMRYGCENGRTKSINLSFPASAITRAP